MPMTALESPRVIRLYFREKRPGRGALQAFTTFRVPSGGRRSKPKTIHAGYVGIALFASGLTVGMRAKLTRALEKKLPPIFPSFVIDWEASERAFRERCHMCSRSHND